MPSILIVVATQGEAARLRQLSAPGLHLEVVVSGVGAVAAALATQRAIFRAAQPPSLVVSAGIGGAFVGSGLAPGDVAVASELVQADLGAWDAEQFLPLQDLGLEVAPGLHGAFAAWTGGAALGLPYGPFVTVNSVTGSHAGAAELLRRVPGALVEGMEGAGVAHAAHLAGLPVTEVRGISNMVGPRERESWQIGPALGALEYGLGKVFAQFAG